jgi:peptide/nickel transport system substrate-binding protein
MVADINYYRKAPGGKGFDASAGDVYATSKYTLVVDMPTFDRNLFYLIGYEDRAVYGPPEMIERGCELWENQVGTGPWQLEEYVFGISFEYVRNPNYWKTTTIDGVEYELPFADRARQLIIPDVSTAVAGLRTGRIDFHQSVPNQYWDSLEKTNPDILSQKGTPGAGYVVAFNTQNESSPVSDLDVRRALMIGTNMDEILGLYPGVDLPKHWWPGGPASLGTFTPLDKEPADIQELYDYNADKAKKMLADAGYPNGFTIGMMIQAKDEVHSELAALVQDQWSRIGVTVELDVLESTTYYANRFTLGYPDTQISIHEIVNPLHLHRWMASKGTLLISGYRNAKFDELMNKANAALNDAESDPYTLEAAQIFLQNVGILPLVMSVQGAYWQPWIKNYYGELNIHDYQDLRAMYAYWWIDESLK